MVEQQHACPIFFSVLNLLKAGQDSVPVGCSKFRSRMLCRISACTDISVSSQNVIHFQPTASGTNTDYSKHQILLMPVFPLLCHPWVSAVWHLQCFVSLRFTSQGFICQDCFLAQGHSSLFTLLSLMHWCQYRLGSWLLKQNRYPWALGSCALISSKHHLPKYLCCIHGRCLERDT